MSQINWPDNPTIGQVYTSPNGALWEWNGYAWDTLVPLPQGATGPAGPSNVLDASAVTTDSTFFPVFVAGTGSQTPSIRTATTAFSFNPSTSALTIGGDLLLNKTAISNQENLDVDSGDLRVIAQIPSATYTAAFFDFVIKKGTNLRSGTVYACHDGTTVEFTETSTADLGTTEEVILSVDILSGNLRFLATTTTNDWIIKTLVRGL